MDSWDDRALDMFVDAIYWDVRDVRIPPLVFRAQLIDAVTHLDANERMVLIGTYHLQGRRIPKRTLMQQLGQSSISMIDRIRTRAERNIRTYLRLPPKDVVSQTPHNTLRGTLITQAILDLAASYPRDNDDGWDSARDVASPHHILVTLLDEAAAAAIEQALPTIIGAKHCHPPRGSRGVS